MLQKISNSKQSNISPSISLVYSSVKPFVQPSLKIKLCCPWHKNHITIIDADKFVDLKNPILNGGYSCIHLACRIRTEDYLLKFIGYRPYPAIGGGV